MKSYCVTHCIAVRGGKEVKVDGEAIFECAFPKFGAFDQFNYLMSVGSDNGN